MEAVHVSSRIRPVTMVLAVVALACLVAPQARAGRVAHASAGEVGDFESVVVGLDALPALLGADGAARDDARRLAQRRPNDPPSWAGQPPSHGGQTAEATPGAGAPTLAAGTVGAEAARVSLLPPDANAGSADDVVSLAAVGVDNVVAPLPPAALTGLPALAGLWAVRQWRRLRRGV